MDGGPLLALEQLLLVVLLCGMLVVFLVDRFRMEVVALTGLALGVLFGLVGPADAFAGFANPAFITVVEILLVVKVLSRSGLLERLSARIVALRLGPTGLLATLCALTAALSVVMNNIGALALMIPVAFGVCRASDLNPKFVLMPVAFASLLGGVCSIVGTPANLIVSQQLALATGTGFSFFSYAVAGLPAALAGIAVLCLLAPRILPVTGSGAATPAPPSLPSRSVVAEGVVPAGSPLVGASPAGLPFELHAVTRAGKRQFLPRVAVLEAGDRLLIGIDHSRLARLRADGAFDLGAGPPDGVSLQAVVMPESTVVGSRIATIEALAARGIVTRAASLQSPRIEGGFADLQLSIGDVLYLEGEPDLLREALEETEMLALEAAESVRTDPPDWRPLCVFLGGVALAAFAPVAPQIAFGLVVLALALAGWLNLRDGLANLPWPVLIMLAAMIPLGEAVETTGTARLLADLLLSALPSTDLPLIASVLLLAVLVTPFVNNASTAIVLGPIAIGIAQAAGLPPEPFLLALALGVSIDFLTPFGHHSNMIVMGLGAYRFADFLRLGLPVTLASAMTGLAALVGLWL